MAVNDCYRVFTAVRVKQVNGHLQQQLYSHRYWVDANRFD